MFPFWIIMPPWNRRHRRSRYRGGGGSSYTSPPISTRETIIYLCMIVSLFLATGFSWFQLNRCHALLEIYPSQALQDLDMRLATYRYGRGGKFTHYPETTTVQFLLNQIIPRISDPTINIKLTEVKDNLNLTKQDYARERAAIKECINSLQTPEELSLEKLKKRYFLAAFGFGFGLLLTVCWLIARTTL